MSTESSTGNLFFSTYSGAVVVDRNNPPSGWTKIVLPHYTALVAAPKRRRPVGWSPYRSVAIDDVVAFEPALKTFTNVPVTPWVQLGISSSGKQMLYLDTSEHYEEFGQHSADTLALSVDGVTSEDQRYELATHLISQVWRHVRGVTNQWWAGRLGPIAEPVLKLQYTKVAENAFNGEAGAVSNGFLVHGDIQPLSEELWLHVLRQLAAQKQPKRTIEVVLDLLYYRSLNEIPTCLLLASSAIETMRDDVFEAAGRAVSGTDLLRHLSHDLERAVSRNLREERADLYEFLRNLWAARGAVVHGGKFIWLADRSRTTPPGDFPTNVGLVLDWLSAIAERYVAARAQDARSP